MPSRLALAALTLTLALVALGTWATRQAVKQCP